VAKLTGQALVDRLCSRIGSAATPTAAQRLAALTKLNEAEQWIAQQGSFKHLEREDMLTLPNNATLVAVPSWVDVGKTMSIGLPDGNGEVKILPSDQWRRDTKYTYGAWNLSTPKTCKIAADASGALFVFFDRQNTSGGNLVYPISAQQLPNTITDSASAGTGSSLPEGYETSILLKRAEFEAKREVRAPVSDAEREDLAANMGRFFDQYRSSKEFPKPDIENKARKVSEQLAEGR
jgi:hypothetical protein